jgi:hypothetical protein
VEARVHKLAPQRRTSERLVWIGNAVGHVWFPTNTSLQGIIMRPWNHLTLPHAIASLHGQRWGELLFRLGVAHPSLGFVSAPSAAQGQSDGADRLLRAQHEMVPAPVLA